MKNFPEREGKSVKKRYKRGFPHILKRRYFKNKKEKINKAKERSFLMNT